MAAMGALCLRVGLNSKPPNLNPPKLDTLDQLQAVEEARKLLMIAQPNTTKMVQNFSSGRRHMCITAMM
ncbi:hypothetical protein ACFX14_033906 [Malus domestica]